MTRRWIYRVEATPSLAEMSWLKSMPSLLFADVVSKICNGVLAVSYELRFRLGAVELLTTGV